MSFLWPEFQINMLTGLFNWTSFVAPAGVYAQLVSTAYTPAAGSFERLDLPSGVVLTPPVRLTTYEVGIAGTAEAANVDFGVITTTAPVGGILLTVQNAAAPSNGDLLFMFLNEGTGFGYSVAGIDCKIVWDTNGIFAP